MVKKLRKLTFGKSNKKLRNIIIITMMFLAVALIISGIYSYTATSLINSEILEMVENDAVSMSDSFDNVLKEVDKISSFLLVDKSVDLYLSSGTVEMPVGNVGNVISKEITAYRYVYDYINSIYLYTENDPNFYFDGNGKKNFTMSGEEACWKELYDQCDDSLITVRTAYGGYPIFLTYVKKKNFVGKSGGVIINIDMGLLNNIVDNSNHSMQKRYIINSDGKIIFMRKIRHLGENINDYINYKKDEEKYMYGKNGYIYAVSLKKTQRSDFFCIVENEIDTAQINRVRMYTVMIILLLAVVGLFGAFFMNKITYKPLKTLTTFLDLLPEERMSMTFDDQETGKVANKLIQVLSVNENLKLELINQIETMDKLKMYALGIQINPHFISSTLNVVHLLMIERYGYNYDDKEILLNTSRCISYILENNEDLVSIDDELMYSNIFVEILKIKGNGGVDIRIETDDNVSGNAKILRLCINTLIENAFYHGISPKSDLRGTILCHISKENDNLICVVEDDGVGMSEAKLKSVTEKLNDNEVLRNANIGFANIQCRIKMIFGGKYGMVIESREGKGTKITIKTPYII